MSLQDQFEAAVAESKQLPEKPDNPTLLKIYALYKQGSVGDVEGDRPGMTDFVGRFKWDAWNELKGTKCVASRSLSRGKWMTPVNEIGIGSMM